MDRYSPKHSIRVLVANKSDLPPLMSSETMEVSSTTLHIVSYLTSFFK
jgi:hypothetical protein